MPQFSYKARDELGKMGRGIQAAEEVDQLADVLRMKNLYLGSLKAIAIKLRWLSWLI